MIKGRYVAQITIDIDYDETSEKCRELAPFDEMKRIIRDGKLTEEIKRVLTDVVAFPEQGITLTVEQQYADLLKEPRSIE